MSVTPRTCWDTPKARRRLWLLRFLLCVPYELQKKKDFFTILYDLVTRTAITCEKGVFARVRKIVRHFCPDFVGREIIFFVPPLTKLPDVRNAIRISAHADVSLGVGKCAIRLFVEFLMAHWGHQTTWKSSENEDFHAIVGYPRPHVAPIAA